MAYNKPSWFVRNVYNRLAKAFGLGKSEVLEIAGRTSGATQKLPVTPVQVGDATYLVSVRGEAEWCRNLDVSTRGSLVSKGTRRDFTAHRIPVADASPVIAAYRAKVGSVIDPIWNKLPEDADHPVYALTF